MSFEGFSHKTLDFLVENRIQNSKVFFEEHRADYNEQVLNPLRELVRELTPTMLDIDPLFTVEPAVNKTIARIYRDVRFSRDKSLYRDEMWITFMRNKKFWQGLPGYYFAFGPDGFAYGVGYYEASADSMDVFRKMILKRDRAFTEMLSAYENQHQFRLEGERYKRTKYPDEPENIRYWLDLKNINFECSSKDFDLLFSKRLSGVLADGFTLLKPLYDFICAVETRRKRDNPPVG
jgi:uncharacterized protein (TIGR02453 family)